MDRHIDFEAIENFRDFGGYGTACGRGLKRGRLYRSGHHAAATPTDLERMRELGVAAIVDLRNPSERALEPGRRFEGFAGRVIDNDIAPTADWVEMLKVSDMSAEWWRASTHAHYAEHAFAPRHVDLFRRMLWAVAERGGALVVHCAAGKDRTGVACALVHYLAGVHYDDIVADFLLTNDETRIARKIVSSGDFCERVTGRRPTDEALRVAAQVFPDYLDTAFASIRERFGTIDAYFADVLGVDAALRARIHDEILT